MFLIFYWQDAKIIYFMKMSQSCGIRNIRIHGRNKTQYLSLIADFGVPHTFWIHRGISKNVYETTEMKLLRQKTLNYLKIGQFFTAFIQYYFNTILIYYSENKRNMNICFQCFKYHLKQILYQSCLTPLFTLWYRFNWI